MKRYVIAIALAAFGVPASLFAQDLGVLVLPIHQGKWTSSIMYENLKETDDFDTRGRGTFTSQISGAQFSYGLTDQIAVSIKGGTLIDPQEDIQGSQWQSRAGYLYGVDLYNEVFPATPGWIPGIQLSGGVTGFQVPLDRTNYTMDGSWQTIDQKMSGFEYHGAVLATFKVSIMEPYAGVRAFDSHVNWQDNESPESITGSAHGNISLVAGLPVQITKEVRFFAEGRFVNETAVTAGFTIAAF